MSNGFAIAAVTRTLSSLLENKIKIDPNQLPDGLKPKKGLHFTNFPLNKARDANNLDNQINLFLYQTTINAAWRNMDMPGLVKPGETGQPPLALNLYYLITAYGEDDKEIFSHLLLGQAMSVLHDHPILDPTEIADALASAGLQDQIERVRITSQPMSLDEISKLWMVFQTQYRISSAYQVEVVLIESKQTIKAALPVLRRGSEDQGVTVLAASLPTITEINLPNSQTSARLNDELIIKGTHLDTEGMRVRFSNLRLKDPIEITPTSNGDETQLRVRLSDLPDALIKLVPGFYTVALVVESPGLPKWTTNEVPFALAPTITVAPNVQRAGNFSLTLTSSPRISENQRVILLFGDGRQIEVQSTMLSNPADNSKPTTLTIEVPNAKQGTYVVRLRVDGADSMPFDPTVTPPQFDPSQKVKIT
jgi:hypothetical protein